ncbi:MAG TPA: DUF6514 family protein [Oscillospiraceae bacterium]|nr:DUF6514 family protein [Oscillospiraceae bacterium]
MRKLNQNYKVLVGNGGLEYCIVQSNEDGHQSYGIELKCSLFGDEDTARIDDISTDFRFMKNLVDILAENLVTPCTARDIVQDILIAHAEAI